MSGDTSHKPLLLLDCYLDDAGCPARFHPPEHCATEVLLAPHMDVRLLDLDVADYRGLVITGSAASVLDGLPWSLAIEKLILDAHRTNVSIFGVCYGHQLIAKALFGIGQVRRSETPEFGWHEIHVTHPDGPLAGAPQSFLCFLSHYDEVATPLPEECQVLAHSENCAVQALRVVDKPIWGVQFHAEMDIAEAGPIFRERVTNSPELGIDAEAMLKLATPTDALWDSIYNGFLASLPA